MDFPIISFLNLGVKHQNIIIDRFLKQAYNVDCPKREFENEKEKKHENRTSVQRARNPDCRLYF